MEPLTTIESHVVVLPRENVDTDQITPARFLRTTSRLGMKDVLFADWRNDPNFVLNRPEAKTARILLAGDNFGCGSSREHAPWALGDWGFRVIISNSFADIFSNNCIKNGILPATVSAEAHATLLSLLAVTPSQPLHVDVANLAISAGGAIVGHFTLDPFAQRCLLEGLDELGYLLVHEAAIAAHESGEPV